MPSTTITNNAQNAVSLAALMQGVGTTAAKHDGESLRLHQRPATQEVELKVHTSISRLGHSNDRTMKRTDAVAMVRQAVLNEFGGKQMIADRILNNLLPAGATRVSLGELKAINAAVAAEKQVQATTIEAAVDALLATPQDAQQVATTRQALAVLFPKKDEARNAVAAYLVTNGLPQSLQSLVDQAHNGSIPQAKAAYDRLKDALPTEVGSPVKEKGAAGALRALMLKALEPVSDDYHAKVFAADGGAAKAKWQPVASHAPMQMPAETLRKFHSQGADALLALPTDKWSIPSSGSGASIIFRDPSVANGGAVIKVHHTLHVKAACDTSAAIEAASAELAKKAKVLPFEAMKVVPVDVAANRQQITDGLAALTTLKTDARTSAGAQNVNDELAQIDTNPQNVAGMKAAFISNATDLNKLSAAERVTLLKGDSVPRQLGGVMIFGRMFGLADHVGITKQATDAAFQGGITNLSNLMINHDSGRLVFIDYGLVEGQRATPGKSGYSEQQMTNAFDAVSNFCLQELGAGKLDATLNGLQTGDKSPIRDLLSAAFSTAETDGLFSIPESGAVNLFSSEDKARFAANALLGAIDAMKFIADNPDAFKAGNPLFDNPKGVVDHVAKLAQGLTQVKADLEAWLAQHPSTL